MKPKQVSKRLTQKDLAQQLGLAQSTVSMALRRHPGIPTKTVERILSLAKQLGYEPDPYLSGLAAYRKQLHPSGYTATLAWLSVKSEASTWRESSIFSGYFQGACDRGIELGYRIEEHWLEDGIDQARRLDKILRARNIKGILLAPQPGANTSMDFDFSRFSVITFGYSLRQPKLHLVSHQHFHSARLAMAKLRDLGYRRIGFVLTMESDKRTFYGWSAGVRSVQDDIPAQQRVTPCLCEAYDRETIFTWLERERPDVVLSVGEEVHCLLESAHIRVPEQMGYAMLNVPDESSRFSGINQHAVLTGARALELLADKLNRREVGVPPIVTQVLVEGSWVEGQTVRALQ